jgi:polyphosphate glucokinase
MIVMGIDIGGSGIKGGLVDVEKGEMTTERYKLLTPEGGKPDDVAAVVKKIVRKFNWNGPIGCGFPSVVIDGVIHTAANVDKGWIGMDADALLEKETGCSVRMANDADVAGIAEMRFGVGKGQSGVVIMLTLGTGIGTAIFSYGVLVPNIELGHLTIRGKDAEARASSGVRKKKQLTYEEWSERLQEYLDELERLFWPNLFIIGGGVSRKSELFFPFLKTRARLEAAQMHNNAGIIGAALYGSEASSKVSV